MKCPYVMKKCSKCGEWLVAYSGNFHKKKGNKYNLNNNCKDCRNTYKRTYYKKSHNLGRLRSDPNEIIIYKDYAEVVLYNNKNTEVARTKIDLEDVGKVRKYKWCLGGRGYAISRENGKAFKMHRFLLECSEELWADHINGDRLDNRKTNLRVVTPQQNCINRGINSNNTSGKSGVCFDKKRNKWYATIKVNNKRLYLGSFNNFKDAVKAREQAEIKYFGEYRRK